MRKLSFAVVRKDKFSLRVIHKVLLPFERLDYIILSPKNFKKFLSGTKKILSGKNFRFLPPRTEIKFKYALLRALDICADGAIDMPLFKRSIFA